MKKIIIIGKGVGWQDAPFFAERLGITQVNLRCHVNKVIDMNNYDLWGPIEADEARNSRIAAEQQNIPYVDLTNYPLTEIINYFKTDYFTNTVDYAIALCIYEGYKEIHFYGVNMEERGEYFWEKPGVEFWCGQAMGRGVKIFVNGERSTILKTKDKMMYGYGIPLGELL